MLKGSQQRLESAQKMILAHHGQRDATSFVNVHVHDTTVTYILCDYPDVISGQHGTDSDTTDGLYADFTCLLPCPPTQPHLVPHTPYWTTVPTP